MKNLIIALLLILPVIGFSQSYDHGVKIDNNEKFVRISHDQMVDTLNINQDDLDQWEYIAMTINKDQVDSLDFIMSNCRSVKDVLNTFGDIQLNISVMSIKDKVTTISGFYYSYNKEFDEIEIIYPRKN